MKTKKFETEVTTVSAEELVATVYPNFILKQIGCCDNAKPLIQEDVKLVMDIVRGQHEIGKLDKYSRRLLKELALDTVKIWSLTYWFTTKQEIRAKDAFLWCMNDYLNLCEKEKG